MKAAVFHGRRDVRVEHVPNPGPPGPGEVLIDVRLASICGTDAAEWSHGPILVPLHRPHPATGRAGPVVLGHEFVGTVAAVGANAELEPGTRVVCGAGVSCGACRWCQVGRTNLCAGYYTLGLRADGGLAERVLAPASICHPGPSSLSDEAAVLAQPLAVALHALRRSRVHAGEVLVVIGVGGIGSFVVAAAAAKGIDEIVAVDLDDRRLEKARRLGASVVVDARHEDVLSAALAVSGGDGVDVVIEASGGRDAPGLAVSAVRRGGRVVLVGLQAQPRPIDLLSATVREIDLLGTLAHVSDEDAPEALDVLAQGDLASVVVDRTIPIDALVEDGLRALADGSAQGKILVDPVS